MSRQWTWFRPGSLDETAGLLLSHGAEAVLVAGGTALCLSPPRRDGQAMIDLQAVPGLDGVEDAGDEVRIGAMATAHGLVTCGSLDQVGSGMLREAGASMGPRPVRNRVTLGGNVMQAFRWCALPVTLLALDGRFELAGPDGSRRVAGADDLLDRQPRRSLQAGELLASVAVTKDQPGEGGAFLELSMTAVDHSLVSAAARLRMSEGRCDAARVAVGALTTLPQRLTAVEDIIVGQKLDDAVLAEASEAAKGAKVNADRRADSAYRSEMAGVLVRRVVATAAARAAGGKGGAPC